MPLLSSSAASNRSSSAMPSTFAISSTSSSVITPMATPIFGAPKVCINGYQNAQDNEQDVLDHCQGGTVQWFSYSVDGWWGCCCCGKEAPSSAPVTSTPPPPPTPSSTTHTPPAETSSMSTLEVASFNCHGSSYCKSMAQNNCVEAIDDYFDGENYTDFNSNWYGAGKACTAMFTCGDSCPAGGMGGSAIKAKFQQLWAPGRCGKCGSVSFEDGSSITLNECDSPCQVWVNGSLYAW